MNICTQRLWQLILLNEFPLVNGEGYSFDAYDYKFRIDCEGKCIGTGFVRVRVRVRIF